VGRPSHLALPRRAENIVIDVENLKALRFRRPGILPDTIIIDHGKPFMSIHVASVCQRLGISIQPAHVYTGTDKAWVERWFRTIDEMLRELPGYKGKDIASRGGTGERGGLHDPSARADHP
jgi:transposase InsO family protein